MVIAFFIIKLVIDVWNKTYFPTFFVKNPYIYMSGEIIVIVFVKGGHL